MHGYSLLRPALNREYFHAVHDRAKEFGIDIEGHHTETGPGMHAIMWCCNAADDALQVCMRRHWRTER